MARAWIIGALALLAGCGKPAAERGPDRPDVDPNLALNTLLVNHQCSNCHASDYARVGPSMKDVAAVLAPQGDAGRQRIRTAILNGAKGNWGEAVMPPQRQVTPAEADALAAAILATAPSPSAPSFPQK